MKKKHGPVTGAAIRGALTQGFGAPTGVETPLQVNDRVNRMSQLSGSIGQQARILRVKRARGY